MSNYERYVDRLFDENNEERIYVKDAEGTEIAFEQVAVIDYEESYYAILAPATPLEGVGEDELLIFYIDEEKDCLSYVEDDKIIDGVWQIFMSDGEDDGE